MDIVTQMLYRSSMTAYLRKLLNNSIKGKIILTIDPIDITITVYRNGHKRFTYTAYGLSKKIDNYTIGKQDITTIAEEICTAYAEKIFQKYFK